MTPAWILTALCAAVLTGARPDPPGPSRYLTEMLGDTADIRQGWGSTGFDTAAYGALAPQPLRIKDRTFSKGVGTHAPAEINVDLAGMYTRFECQVGVQWQNGTTGTVVFQVYVDGRKRFDSGRMAEVTPAKPVSIDLRGAEEMRLVATDAGDGITCDCANWADARLLLAEGANAGPPPSLDVGPFGRVIVTDPTRADGARANRVQEYRAEDLLMDLDAPRERDAWVARSSDGLATIGLRWPERRAFTQLGLEFAGPAPDARNAQVQGWFGESLYQGTWKPIPGLLVAAGTRWTYTIGSPTSPEVRAGMRKVRWVWHGGPASVKALTALSPVATRVTVLHLSRMPGAKRGTTTVTAYNGYIGLTPGKADLTAVDWDASAGLDLAVQYTRTRTGRRAEATVLRFSLPDGPVAVRVDDVLAAGTVWVPEAQLVVSSDAQGKASPNHMPIVGAGKTVLGRVRSMPEQTLERALKRTHHARQELGPVLLSLACDNRKFEVSREGAVKFERLPEVATTTPDKPLVDAVHLNLAFGPGQAAWRSRAIDGGWLPAPVHTFTAGAITYRERVYVAPAPGGPVCVVEVEASNPTKANAPARIALALSRPGAAASAVGGNPALTAWVEDGRVLACADARNSAGLRATLSGGTVTLDGQVAAGATARCAVRIPAWQCEPARASALADLAGLWEAFRGHWEAQVATGARLEIPDPLLANAILASRVHCLLAARNEAGGERIAPWIASMYYGPLESEAHSIVRGMDMLGHHDFARRCLDYYVARYSPEGLLTTGYTLMGTGWHLWTLGEHFGRTQNRDWMQRIAPDVERVCRWITRQRAGNQVPELRGSPVWGLMPPGVQADWNAFSYWYALNGYYYAGLQGAATALRSIGRPGSEDLLTDAAAFRADILASYNRVKAIAPVYPLANGTWVTPYPSQADLPGPCGDYYPGEDGNRSWCYDVELGAHHLAPLGVLDHNSPEVTRIIEHQEDVQFLGEGWFDYPAVANQKAWFDLGGFAKVQPYYARNAEIYARRGDAKPFIRSYFNTIAAMLNLEVLSLWEHFSASGAWNKTHETGYFLQQTAMLMATERGDGLWLAALTPASWLEDGRSLGVEGLPTQWGPVTYRVTSHANDGWMEATVAPPTRGAPPALRLVLRHPKGHRLARVTVNGVPHRDFDRATNAIRLATSGGTLAVKAHFASR